ncbi:PAS domain S-box protein [Geomonas sp. Red32]|uniref:PAS domain-containing hybrid sensor histidine kinase/response regulator n=1 Tax=Geomonas sp. Red32 TaxID=2912856 RepID=UPI00202CD741|nr:PAS domain S-box protein [Geomonas sp. Red32]MCM0082586.1 PAS domain S-box protein [Geomonas sp. Red32]
MGDDHPASGLAELFAELCDPWDQACFLVTSQGEVVAVNQAGLRILGAAPGAVTGEELPALVANPPENVRRYLLSCAGSRNQLPGVLTCQGNDGKEIRYRVAGFRVDTSLTSTPLIFLRCTLTEGVVDRFTALNRQLDKQHLIQHQLSEERDQLQVEIAERKRIEERLRTTSNTLNMIVENLPDMIFLKDAKELRYVRFNHAGEALLGVSREEMLGKNDADLFPACQAEFFTRKDHEVLEKKDVLDIPEEPILAGGGKTVILHTKKVPILDEAGEPVYLLGISEDITERRKAEEALRASEEKYRTVADFTYDWEYWIGPDKSFVYCSPACERITGYPAADFLAEPSLLERIIHPEDREQLSHEHFNEAEMSAAEVGECEFRIIDRSGAVRWISHVCRRVYGANGAWLGRRGANRDITDRKTGEEERIALERQLLHAQKLESLGILAGGIAHDFNNILMAILGNAELALLKIPPGAPCLEHLHQIGEAATRAADLAKQMLAYSGRGKFYVEPLDLNRILTEMLHMLEVAISKKAVLRLNLADSSPIVVADATQIRQIVMNLAINASEAIGERSGTITVTTGHLQCEAAYLKDASGEGDLPAGCYAFIEVSDTGCGMDRETVSRIFDPFFSTKFTGRGLGLSAVLGIVRGHRGCIKVYSERGMGTTFKILLPASQNAPAAAIPGGRDDGWQGSGVALLVDDEEAVRKIGSDMLKELGFTPVTASDGREAVEIYRNHPEIAVVILDLTMPHLDGKGCFQQLRQIDPEARVIVSSGFNEQETLAIFAGRGVAGFIQKPYRLSALREVLMKVSPPLSR